MMGLVEVKKQIANILVDSRSIRREREKVDFSSSYFLVAIRIYIIYSD